MSPVNFAPIFRGRSQQNFTVWEADPQFVQAFLRNFDDFDETLAPFVYQLDSEVFLELWDFWWERGFESSFAYQGAWEMKIGTFWFSLGSVIFTIKIVKKILINRVGFYDVW